MHTVPGSESVYHSHDISLVNAHSRRIIHSRLCFELSRALWLFHEIYNLQAFMDMDYADIREFLHLVIACTITPKITDPHY